MKSTIVEEHPVLGGKSKVLKYSDRRNYYFRMWVTNSQSYIRESLGTSHLSDALDAAEGRTLEILSDLRSGRSVFGITLDELGDRYVTSRQLDVEVGSLTKGRLQQIRNDVKRFCSFYPNLKLDTITPTTFYDYPDIRRKDNPSLKYHTLRNEMVALKQTLKWGMETGLMSPTVLKFKPHRKAASDTGRRDTFSLAEYDSIVRRLRHWIGDKAINASPVYKDLDAERYRRLVYRDLFLIASNTMLRVGELFGLRWGDVGPYEIRKDDRGTTQTLVSIRVRAETSKVGRLRFFSSRGGQYFQRLRDGSRFSSDNDLVFTFTGNRFTDKHKDAYWASLMQYCGIDDYSDRKLTFYTLRHFGITCRLRAGNTVYDIAQVCGTSVGQIEAHYGHFDEEMSKNLMLKSFSVSKDGLEFVD